MALRHDFRSRPPEQVRVVVFGATGYIGRFVVQELVERCLLYTSPSPRD